MKDKIKDLLAVLDMPEDEQRKAIGKYLFSPPYFCSPVIKGRIHEHPGFNDYVCSKCGKENPSMMDECLIAASYTGFFADLAFRLRDDVCNSNVAGNNIRGYSYYCALTDVYKRCGGYEECGIGGVNLWIYRYSQPIHWIIAALIAKELAKVKDDDETNKT